MVDFLVNLEMDELYPINSISKVRIKKRFIQKIYDIYLTTASGEVCLFRTGFTNRQEAFNYILENILKYKK